LRHSSFVVAAEYSAAVDEQSVSLAQKCLALAMCQSLCTPPMSTYASLSLTGFISGFSLTLFRCFLK